MNSYKFIIRFCKTVMAVNTSVMRSEAGIQIRSVLDGLAD